MIEPAPLEWVRRVGRIIGPAYVRVVMGVARVTIAGADHLRGDDVRIVAFRHPSPDDPVIAWVYGARAIAPERTPLFLYGRDVPVWGGPFVGWALRRSGAISVFHDAMSRRSLDLAHAALADDRTPLFLAPEAQITYHNDFVAACQRGTAYLAVSARRRPIAIASMGFAYRYPDRGYRRFTRLLNAVARDVGMRAAAEAAVAADPLRHLLGVFDALITILEAEIARHAGDSTGGDASRATTTSEAAPTLRALEARQRRVEALLEATLVAAERIFAVTPRGDAVSRLFRVRHRYWERLFPSGDTRAPLARDLADIGATEAKLGARFMQLVDVLAYVDLRRLAPVIGAPRPGTQLHARLVEYLLIAGDLANRARGGAVAHRPTWRGRTCTIAVTPPVAVPGAPDGTAKRMNIQRTHDHVVEALERASRAAAEVADGP